MEARLATRGSNTVFESAAKKELVEENNKVYLLEVYSLCLLCLVFYSIFECHKILVFSEESKEKVCRFQI